MHSAKKLICTSLLAAVTMVAVPNQAWSASWGDSWKQTRWYAEALKIRNYWHKKYQEIIVDEPVVVEEPVVEDPVVVTDPVVEEPVVVTDPVVEDPAAQDPVVQDPTVQDPVVVTDPVVEDPVVVIDDPVVVEDPVIEPEPEVVPEPQPRALQLSWVIPTTREDGTPLSMAEIKGYEIYYTSDTLNEEGTIVVSDGAASAYSLELMEGDTYHFAIAAVDSSGLKSKNSDFVSISLTP